MSNKISFVLLLISCLGNSSFNASFGQDREAMDLRPPKHIEGSCNLPSWHEMVNWKTSVKTIIMPRVIYETAFIGGWNEIVYRYGFLEYEIDDCRGVGLGNSFNTEEHTGLGVVDGMTQAINRLADLEKNATKDEIRQIAKESFLKVKTDHLVFIPSRSTPLIDVRKRAIRLLSDSVQGHTLNTPNQASGTTSDPEKPDE